MTNSCTERWLKAWGIKLASEKQLRKQSEQQMGNNLQSEAVPFCFPLKSGIDLRPAPLVYVPDLVKKVIQTLDQNNRYIHVCT